MPAGGYTYYDVATGVNYIYDGMQSIWRPIISVVPTAVKTSAYTALYGDLVICDSTSGAFTVTLPTAIGGLNRCISVKKKSPDVNIITVQANGAETIDGANTQLISAVNTNIMMISDNSNWIII